MKRLTAAIGTMIGLGLLAAPAMAADSGRVSLQPGEAKQIYIGSTARELRICNDSTSGGELAITLGSREPFSLVPGRCAYDSGDRIVASNRGDSPALATWVTDYGPSGDHQRMKLRGH
jgi:hypothetical protein